MSHTSYGNHAGPRARREIEQQLLMHKLTPVPLTTTMKKRLRKPATHGLGAGLVAITLLLAACGDDDDTTDDAQPEDAGSEDAGSEETAEGDDAGSPATSGPSCDIVPADEVAAAAGIEVSSTTPSTGTASYQEIDYSTVGCTYETADGGSVSINALADDTGGQLPPDVLADLMAASEASSFDDYPHEEVPDLGNGGLFLASLGPSDSLVIDASPGPVLEISNHRELPLSRDALQAVGEVAVQAYS